MAGTGEPAAVSRLDRRKARTRQALVDAAVHLIAAGRGERASIQEITEAADVGFGSFYNHFTSKDELFEVASTEVLERWGQLVDEACAGIADPAEALAIAFRMSARLGWTHPEVAHFLSRSGLDLLDEPSGMAPRALRDITAGKAAGRFTFASPDLALASVAANLLAVLWLREHHPDRIEESAVDQLAEAILRELGVTASEAARLAARPLPASTSW